MASSRPHMPGRLTSQQIFCCRNDTHANDTKIWPTPSISLTRLWNISPVFVALLSHPMCFFLLLLFFLLSFEASSRAVICDTGLSARQPDPTKAGQQTVKIYHDSRCRLWGESRALAPMSISVLVVSLSMTPISPLICKINFLGFTQLL